MIAPYLTSLQERLRPQGVQVGSYPVLYKGVFVSLIGRELSNTASASNTQGPTFCLTEVAKEVEREVGGKIVSEEDVRAKKSEGEPKALDGSSSESDSEAAEKAKM